MIVTLPLAGGCIRENMDDCKGKVTLRFRYVGDGTTDIFPEKIEHVTMYVYSIADGSLASIREDARTIFKDRPLTDDYLFANSIWPEPELLGLVDDLTGRTGRNL